MAQKEHGAMIADRCVAAAVLMVLMADSAAGQNIIAYPEKGQSEEQQHRDRYDCYSWAVQQTGFNPQAAAGTSAPPPPEGGGVIPGAFGGAALGAIGGAIGGNAGKGAAIGALAGGLFGGFRRRQVEMQEEQQQAAVHARRDATFNRAMGACLRGRGYSID
jgi:hypothetical protein